MFRSAFVFNQPLQNWDTSNVTNMSCMFRNAGAFVQPLDKWNMSNVIFKEHMFHLDWDYGGLRTDSTIRIE